VLNKSFRLFAFIALAVTLAPPLAHTQASYTESVVYDFCSVTNCGDGQQPEGGLIQGSDGNFYGTTGYGGGNNAGIIFKLTPSGELTTLHTFCRLTNCADGSGALSLVQGSDGNFYGATPGGGKATGGGAGTIFKMTPAGDFTTLYSFCSQTGCPDGLFAESGLVQGTDGNFYGTTQSGGANGRGTIYNISPTGSFTLLYSFCNLTNCTDGEYPQYGALVQGTDSNFYGTTLNSDYKITATGEDTTLASFGGDTGLVEAANGDYYGATNSYSIYDVTSTGPGTVDVALNYAEGLFPGSNGNLFGTTGNPENEFSTGSVFEMTPRVVRMGQVRRGGRFCRVPMGRCTGLPFSAAQIIPWRAPKVVAWSIESARPQPCPHPCKSPFRNPASRWAAP
jgi:uncharacterized repeat protein (TIGR03803 family)